MSDFQAAFAELIRRQPPPAADAPGGRKKNYTSALSHQISRILAQELGELGLAGTVAPTGGRDKSFMGGYGPKGVDVYLSDEKHGLLLTSGVKGLIFDPRKNLKNRYRDEEMGIVLFDPGDPDSLDLAPTNVPATLHAARYPERLVDAFNRRNPFY